MVRSVSVDENGIKRGAWSKEEDDKLKAYITRYGHWNWRELPKFAGLSRCGKSCRLRWVNYLQPNVKRGSYTKEEEEIITKLHDQLGKKWSVIAKQLPGRTDNEIKNYWHTHIKKRKNIVTQNSTFSSTKCTSGSTNSCQFEENQENINISSSNQSPPHTSTTTLLIPSESPEISTKKINEQEVEKDLSISHHKKTSTFGEEQMSKELATSCGSDEMSSSSFDDPLNDLMTWVGEDNNLDSFDSFTNMVSPPLIMDSGLMYPASPIIGEEFLWSYHLGDELNNW